MSQQQYKRQPSTSGKEEEDLHRLPEKECSDGIRSGAGQPVLCLHRGEAILADEDVIDHIIDYICDQFVAVFDILPVEENPELISSLKFSGHCLGMLEPRTNILVNVILHSRHQMVHRKSAWIMTDKIRRSCRQRLYWRAPANQSLHGLVVFLMYYFRYLSQPQALRYLFLAHCDLVLAIGLVEFDLRNRQQFTFDDSDSMVTRAVDALRLAAIAANHPNVDMVETFASRSFEPNNAENFSRMMSDDRLKLDKVSMNRIAKLLRPQKEVPKVTVASLRHESFSALSVETLLPDVLNQMPNVEPCDYSNTVRRILLDALHTFYMKAFDCLAPSVFCALQTAILRSGLCFGPFGDPVDNILLNAIWFKAAFQELCPKLSQLLVHSERISMLCRISLDANISFLCRKYNTLSCHDAILLLYQGGLNRSCVDDVAARRGYSSETDEHGATVHALQAANLPQCEHHMVSFHSTINPEAKARAIALLRKHHHERFLNLSDVNAISDALEIHPLYLPPSTVPQLSDKSSSMLTQIRRGFKHKGHLIKGKLRVMLESWYVVSSEVEILCIVGGQRFFLRGKPFFHVNVLARNADNQIPKYDLFFAQLHESQKYDPEFDVLVDLELTLRMKDQPSQLQPTVWFKAITSGRCLPCESAVTNIIHPIQGRYVGKDGENFVDGLVSVHGACEGDTDDVLEARCVYFDHHSDPLLVEQLEGLHDELGCFIPSD